MFIEKVLCYCHSLHSRGSPFKADSLVGGGPRAPLAAWDVRASVPLRWPQRCWASTTARVWGQPVTSMLVVWGNMGLQRVFPCIPRPNRTRALVARPVFWKRALHLLGEGHQSTAARRWTLNFTQKYAIVLDKDALVKITQVITPWLNRHLADVKGWFNLGRPRYSEVNYSIVGFKPTETIWRLNLWFVPSQNAERLSSSYSLTWSFPHSLTCNVS